MSKYNIGDIVTVKPYRIIKSNTIYNNSHLDFTDDMKQYCCKSAVVVNVWADNYMLNFSGHETLHYFSDYMLEPFANHPGDNKIKQINTFLMDYKDIYEFDTQVNETLFAGWTLVRRDIITNAKDIPTSLYAEFERYIDIDVAREELGFN